jgi:mxaA protein
MMSWPARRQQACGLALTCITTAAGAQGLQASTAEPRAFGYHVGDVVVRSIQLQVPAGLQIDATSLPTVGRRGRAFELRQVQWQGPSRWGAPDSHGRSTQQLRLEYQVFVSPPQVRTLELPPLVLRFEGTASAGDAGALRAQELRIDAWPITVSPLMPVDPSPRQGLGEWQPDAAPPLLNTRPQRLRLMACAGLLALLLAYLAHVYGGAPWWAKRGRPFQQAWRQLQSLRTARGGAQDVGQASQQRQAFEALHQAFNTTAGAVLFAPGLVDFINAHPRYGALRADLEEFFQRSTQEFFEAHAPSAQMPWLLQLCQRCRDIERGAA